MASAPRPAWSSRACRRTCCDIALFTDIDALPIRTKSAHIGSRAESGYIACVELTAAGSPGSGSATRASTNARGRNVRQRAAIADDTKRQVEHRACLRRTRMAFESQVASRILRPWHAHFPIGVRTVIVPRRPSSSAEAARCKYQHNRDT